MIAKAIFYHVEQFCNGLYEEMQKENGLYDKIMFTLRIVEKEIAQSSCVFRLIHAMTDNSLLGKKMQMLEETQTQHGFILRDIVRKLIIDECGEDKMPSEEKVEYLIICLLSKMVCYGMLLKKTVLTQDKQRDELRKTMCDGICKEFYEVIG